MEKFFEVFRKNIKTNRLELRILEPTMENAELVWNAIKGENSADFKYIHYSPNFDKPLPESLEETLDTMKNYADAWRANGVIWYVFQNGNLIGYHGATFNKYNNTVGGGNVWFIKSAWGHGFNKEIQDKIEDLAFNELKAHRIVRQCMAENTRSQKSISSSGFHLDGRLRDFCLLPDGTYMDHLVFSKLAREYKK